MRDQTIYNGVEIIEYFRTVHGCHKMPLGNDIVCGFKQPEIVFDEIGIILRTAIVHIESQTGAYDKNIMSDSVDQETVELALGLWIQYRLALKTNVSKSYRM